MAVSSILPLLRATIRMPIRRQPVDLATMVQTHRGVIRRDREKNP